MIYLYTEKEIPVIWHLIGLMIVGFILGNTIARYKWNFMWLFYTGANSAVGVALYYSSGTPELLKMSLYFSLFAVAMFIGLYSGDGGNRARK